MTNPGRTAWSRPGFVTGDVRPQRVVGYSLGAGTSMGPALAWGK